MIFTSLSPIFDSIKVPVQIAQLSFELSDANDDIKANVKILTRDESFPKKLASGEDLGIPFAK